MMHSGLGSAATPSNPRDPARTTSAILSTFLVSGLLNGVLAIAHPGLRRLHKTDEFSQPYVPEFIAPSVLVLVGYIVVAAHMPRERRSALGHGSGQAAVILAGFAQLLFVLMRPQPHTWQIDTRLLFLIIFFALPLIAGLAATVLVRRRTTPLALRSALCVFPIGYLLGMASLFANNAPPGSDYISQSPLWFGAIQTGSALIGFGSTYFHKDEVSKEREEE